MSYDSTEKIELPTFKTINPPQKSPEEKMADEIARIPESERINYDSIRYGQMVQVYDLGGRHTAVKVHFFNRRGVLVGNIYEFVPYERLRLHHKGVVWERVYYGKRFEKVRSKWYEFLCRVTTRFIRVTQSICQ